MRGNNFRLGYAEGELLYRLVTEPNPDAAAASLYTTTPLRPSPEEIAGFITMLQKEGLAILPKEEVIQRETQANSPSSEKTGALNIVSKILRGSVSFRIPLLRPDAFLNRTLPYVSWLWSPFLCWFYIIAGLTGLVQTLQEIELYFSTVSYLFTPQGSIAFFLCLALLKTGHEFAHAYATKTLGKDLHVRSMGILFIVFWPLLYTDTTDIWKIPDRRLRIRVSLAGILFELAVAGIALLLWSLLPDGIPRSLMFFLSGTSIVSSVFINLNPFMRFDGYYVLMDVWGIDNLRPRAFAMLRYAVRRLLFDWKGAAPEIHPHARTMIVYGFLAVLYRIFIAFSIAVAVYYLFFPIMGLVVLAMEFWMFIIRPLLMETDGIIKNRKLIGSKRRLALTVISFMLLCALVTVPLPRFKRLPCLLLLKGTTKIEAASPGQLTTPLPPVGVTVTEGDLLTRISSDSLEYDAQNVRFDLDVVRTRIDALGSGGEEGAYRNWLMAEEKRLMAASDKLEEAIAQLEIRAPIAGRITDINEDIYEGAFVAGGTYLFTIAIPEAYELKAFVHEHLAGKMDIPGHGSEADSIHATVRFPESKVPALEATFREKSVFPAHYLPNVSLLDIAGGPIMSVKDTLGPRPRDAYFAFTFDVQDAPARLPHGMPSWTWMRSERQSILEQAFGEIWKRFMERGLF